MNWKPDMVQLVSSSPAITTGVDPRAGLYLSLLLRSRWGSTVEGGADVQLVSDAPQA